MTATNSAARKPFIQKVWRLMALHQLGSAVGDLGAQPAGLDRQLLTYRSDFLTYCADLLGELLTHRADLLGELLTHRTDLLGQLLSDQRDLLADVVPRGDLLDHLALDHLDHAGGLLVGEACLLEASDRVSGVHLDLRSVLPADAVPRPSPPR